MKDEAPDFGDAWAAGGDEHSGTSDDPTKSENPWAVAPEYGGPRVSPVATKSPKKKGSSSTALKGLVVLLSIALIAVSAWAIIGSSDGSGIEELESEAAKVPALEARIESMESTGGDAARGRDLLKSALGDVNPCSIPGYGWANPTYWEGRPDMGVGCIFSDGQIRTLMVTVAPETPEPIDEVTVVDNTPGYLVSGNKENYALYVWAEGPESEARDRATEVLLGLHD